MFYWSALCDVTNGTLISDGSAPVDENWRLPTTAGTNESGRLHYASGIFLRELGPLSLPLDRTRELPRVRVCILLDTEG